MAYHELCKNVLGTETQDPLLPIDGKAEYLHLQLLALYIMFTWQNTMIQLKQDLGIALSALNQKPGIKLRSKEVAI